MNRRIVCLVLCFIWVGTVVAAEQVKHLLIKVEQFRGIDSSVAYHKLSQFGPWDDRNYAMTAADVALLDPKEASFKDPIPAFYRAKLRAKMLSGALYPRSAFNAYRQRYGGYLINGKLYNKTEMVKGQFRIIESTPLKPAQVFEKFLTSNVRVTNPNRAAESAVAIKPTDEDIVIAGSNGPGGGQRMHRSTDGGETWNQLDLPLGNTCCDPTIGWSTDGANAYTATLGDCGAVGAACQIWFYRSDDDGQSWTGLAAETPGDPRRELTTAGNSDKEYLHVDNFPGSPHQDNVYLTWHDNNIMQFSHSTDRGNTFSAVQSFTDDPRGIGSDITTDRDGRVFFIWPELVTPAIVFRASDDGGETFNARATIATMADGFDFPIPAMETRRAFQYVSADVDYSDGAFSNSIYVAWTENINAESDVPEENHARIRVAYSRDAGATWDTTVPHQVSNELQVDRFHQWLKVDEIGVIHLIFYGTNEDPSRQSTNLYYTFSEDGGVSFAPTQKITDVASGNIGDGFEYGDYNGLDVLGDQIIAIYTDNRNEDGGDGDSVDVYATGGFGVFDATFTLGTSTDVTEVCAPAQVVTDLSVQPALGFAGTVDLSSTLPVGAENAVFSPASIAVPGTSQLTFDVSTDAPATLQVPVSAASGPTTRTQNITLAVAAGLPAAATAEQPSIAAVGTFPRAFFSWVDPSDSGNYELEVATDTAFTNIISSATTDQQSLTLATELDPQTQYFWRVTTTNLCGETASTTANFTTGSLVCATPDLAIPDNEPSGASTSLSFASSEPINNLAVSVQITHTFIGDLAISLENEDSNTEATLGAFFPGCGVDNLDTVFSGQGLSLADPLCLEFTIPQTVQSTDSLTAFDDQAGDNTYTISIVDRAGLDVGTLDRWCLGALIGDGVTDFLFADGFEEQ